MSLKLEPLPALGVAGGSLPVWQRELFDLADEWDARARRAKTEQEYHRFRDSTLQRQYEATWATYKSCAEDLRRQIVAGS